MADPLIPRNTALTVTIPNRVAEICMDPKRIAENAEQLRRLCAEHVDDGTERSVHTKKGG